MFEFLWWLMIGLAAGGLARFLFPGKQAMSLYGTLTVGLLGSILGGAVSSMIYGFNPLEPGFHPAGLLLSTVGALVVLGSYIGYARRSARLTRTVL
jgi:uncharacterized membrane protein YeaQ/YmgE (transglycosylase-associated protein family)